jgi:GNAT superfamily N-acetyltransferase
LRVRPRQLSLAADAPWQGVGAADAEAIYNATGVRVPNYPITLDKLLDRLPSLSWLHGCRFSTIHSGCTETFMTHIRKIGFADRSEWVRMRDALWPGSLSDHRSETENYFDESLELPVVFVAEEAGGLVGFLELDFRKYAPGCRSSPVAFVEGWYVDPHARGRGAGRSLMREAEAYARIKGSEELASDAELDNLEGIVAHAALGFEEVEQVACFRRQLSAAPHAAAPATATIRAVMPVLMCRDVAAAVLFYGRLGFDRLFQDSATEPRYAVVKRDLAQLHLQWVDANQWHAKLDRPNYRLLVADVDLLFKELAAKGAAGTGDSPWAVPATTPWGTREFHVRDPDGNGLQLFTPQSADVSEEQ